MAAGAAHSSCFRSFHSKEWDWGAMIRSRKHTCSCVTSRWGVGPAWLVPVLVPGEAQGTISHRAAVHTELIIISFLNILPLAPPAYSLQAPTELLKTAKWTHSNTDGHTFCSSVHVAGLVGFRPAWVPCFETSAHTYTPEPVVQVTFVRSVLNLI